MVANNFVLSAFQICTMCRSLFESASAKVYVPAGSIMPGTSNASLNVILVCLFHSSAFAFGKAKPKIMRRHNTVVYILNGVIYFFLFSSVRKTQIRGDIAANKSCVVTERGYAAKACAAIPTKRSHSQQGNTVQH